MRHLICMAVFVSILDLCFSFDVASEINMQPSRLMITFFTENDNDVTNVDLDGAVIAKQYGRRLLLDLMGPFDLDTQREKWMTKLKNVEMVEVDGIARASFGLYFPPWNFKDNEPFSVKVEEVLNNPIDNRDVVVAVLDTGIAEIAKVKFPGLRNGYDFASDVYYTKDGDGRDADATDPGDGGATCASTWHGTTVSSIIGAVHWGPVVRGIAPHCTLLSVRIGMECGTCSFSDMADAIVWAAGGRINGVPDNTARAHIISVSFGQESACLSFVQSAINQAASLGSLVIVAAGNDAVHASRFAPANCANVVSVAASGRDGFLAPYSNWGATVTAPGGRSRRGDQGLEVWIVNQQNQLDNVIIMGTSLAAPHVAALASLIKHDALNTIRDQFNRYIASKSSPLSPQDQVCVNGTSNCAGELITWPKLKSATDMIPLVNCSASGLQMCYTPGGTNRCTFGCMCEAGYKYSFFQNLSGAVFEGCIECPAGTFSPSHGFKTECTACPSCPQGQYRKGCGPTSGSCSSCIACPQGQYTTECGGSSPGVCTNCGLQCGSSEYVSADCGGFSPGVCSLCQYAFSCANPNLVLGPFKCITQQSTCVSCPSCPVGKYRKAVCGNLFYEECTLCPSCSEGKYRTACRDSNSGYCASCATCPSGQYRTGCSGLTSGTCTQCGSCPEGQYLAGCSGLTGGTCTPCRNCSVGSWLNGCSALDEGVCVTCTN